MADIPDIRRDLPMSMTMAAFVGISWYIGAEINVSLFMRFKRRGRGLYFWACALASWGVILQPLFIVLADFGVWIEPFVAAITLIYLTWLIMVVPQSWVLYSRLHLIMQDERVLRWIKAALLFNSVVFSVPTIVLGVIAQATSINPNLFSINTIWDRLQLIVFFVQETSLSILYIVQARKFLRDISLLHRKPVSSTATATTIHDASLGSASSPRSNRDRDETTKQVLQHLIYTNLLIIALDVTLLGIQSADLFYLQGAFKPCVYGVKLKVEFAILNRLIKSVRAHSYSGGSRGYFNSGAGAGDEAERGHGPARPISPVSPGGSVAFGAGGGPPGDDGRSGSGGYLGRHRRTRSGGEEILGDPIRLHDLDRGNGLRSRSQESRSPILARDVSTFEFGDAKPAECEEDDHARPEDPLVLLGAPLDHAYGVATDAERVGNAVEPLLCVLQHLALSAQVAEDGLASAYRVRSHHLHLALRATYDAAAPIPVRRHAPCQARRRISVGILRRSRGERPTAQQLGAVGGVQGLLARPLELVEARAVVGELGAEVAEALVRLVLLGGARLLARERRVLVERAREGRQRRRDGAQRRGSRRVGGGGGCELDVLRRRLYVSSI
ncbi:hypothetical protein DL771_005627 [Monosporascus sp. 5C6A]|nr:hypothetical protein DL771_005627 [Monosporascus sp. 5C6A]